MNELNEKLLEFAGFVYHNYDIHEYEYKDTIVDDPYWEDPNGQECEILPDFPNDLNACFEWLVPKLEKYPVITFNTDKGGYTCCTLSSPPQIGVYAHGDTPAQALCKAIEKLIDAGKP